MEAEVPTPPPKPKSSTVKLAAWRAGPAVNLLAVHDHVAQVDSNAELHPAFERETVVLDLQCNLSFHRVDYAGELGEHCHRRN